MQEGLQHPATVPAREAGSGRFEGYASLFNLRDRSGDVVRPGAFRRTLAAKPVGEVRLLHQHKAEEPIGVWEEIREDGRGLFVRRRTVHPCLFRQGGERQRAVAVVGGKNYGSVHLAGTALKPSAA
jgi:hypothetical protein